MKIAMMAAIAKMAENEILARSVEILVENMD
jgi:hypothetical protein